MNRLALYGVIFAVGASAVAGVFYYGKSIGAAGVEASAGRKALDRIEELDKNNASFKRGTDRDRCVIFMRDSGLPVSECD